MDDDDDDDDDVNNNDVDNEDNDDDDDDDNDVDNEHTTMTPQFHFSADYHKINLIKPHCVRPSLVHFGRYN